MSYSGPLNFCLSYMILINIVKKLACFDPYESHMDYVVSGVHLCVERN